MILLDLRSETFMLCLDLIRDSYKVYVYVCKLGEIELSNLMF
jgi:hypothetical protein